MLHFLFLAKLIYLSLWLAMYQLKIKFLVLLYVWKYRMPQEHTMRSLVWQLVIDSNNMSVLAFYLSPARWSLPRICVGSRPVTHVGITLNQPAQAGHISGITEKAWIIHSHSRIPNKQKEAWQRGREDGHSVSSSTVCYTPCRPRCCHFNRTRLRVTRRYKNKPFLQLLLQVHRC